MNRIFVSAAFFAMIASAQPGRGPQPELLWPAGAPGAQGTEDVDKPTLTPYVMPAGR